jgi:hypothetical protein
MAIQCIDFSEYSCSIIVISSFYAATAFIKNFKEIQFSETANFINEVRNIIFQMIQE